MASEGRRSAVGIMQQDEFGENLGRREGRVGPELCTLDQVFLFQLGGALPSGMYVVMRVQ